VGERWVCGREERHGAGGDVETSIELLVVPALPADLTEILPSRAIV
jgi:hypothetical protein